MALEEGVRNTKFSLDSELRDETREELSPEDVAWVDSCLVKESEISDISDSSWDSVKDALLEVLNSKPGSYDSSPESLNEKIPIENDFVMVTLSDHVELESDHSLMNEDGEDIPRNLSNLIPFRKESDSLGDSFMAEGVEDLKPMAFSGDPFLPSYTEESEETRIDESNSGPSFSLQEAEPSSDEIFRVWDLNLSPEENELAIQLNSILEQNGLESKPSLDNVTDGISKMSLSQSRKGN